jgi:hypothetical protein
VRNCREKYKDRRLCNEILKQVKPTKDCSAGLKKKKKKKKRSEKLEREM